MKSSPATRPSLLLRLRDRGNHAAWFEFLQLYEPVIYRLARRRQLQDADAREIVQEVLLRVAGTIDRFDPAIPGSFRGWLSLTTRRVAVDRFRRLIGQATAAGGDRNLLESVPLATQQELETEFDREHRRQLFRAAASEVRTLVSTSSWNAFWQTAVEDRSARDVANMLGISEGAVYVARCRVLKRIREFIEQLETQ